MPSFLSDRSPTICDHIAQRSGTLGSNGAMSAGDGRTTELRIRISQRGGGSARCSGSRALVQPRNSCQRMASECSTAPQHVVRIAARSLSRPLGRAEVRCADHLLDVDGRRALATHGLRRTAGGQASRAGVARALNAVSREEPGIKTPSFRTRRHSDRHPTFVFSVVFLGFIDDAD